MDLSAAATAYVTLSIGQKGVVAQRKRTDLDKVHLRDAGTARKKARVALNRHDSIHLEINMG